MSEAASEVVGAAPAGAAQSGAPGGVGRWMAWGLGLLGFLTLCVLGARGIIAKIQRESSTKAPIGILRMIEAAQHRFYEEDPDKNGVKDYADSLEMLHAVGLIDAEVARGVKGSSVRWPGVQMQLYTYRVQLHPGKGRAAGWIGTAGPVDRRQGIRYFYLDESGVMRYSDGQPAGPDSKRVQIGL